MFNKKIITFLIIILNLNSSNLFSMQRIDIQNLNQTDKERLLSEKNNVNEIKENFEENGENYYIIGLSSMLQKLSDLKFLGHIQDAKNLIIKIKDLLLKKIKKQLETDKYLTENDLKNMIDGLQILKKIKKLESIKETIVFDSLNETDFIELINKIVIKINKIKENKENKEKMNDLMNLAKKTGKTFTKQPDSENNIKKPKQPETLFSNKTKKEMRAFDEFD